MSMPSRSGRSVTYMKVLTGVHALLHSLMDVYTARYSHEVVMPRIAKVFRSGNSQAVRLPKDFRLEVSEVEISREGDALILRPKPATGRPWASLRAAVERGFSKDFLIAGREQPVEQQRPGLDQLFP